MYVIWHEYVMMLHMEAFDMWSNVCLPKCDLNNFDTRLFYVCQSVKENDRSLSYM